MLAKDRMVQLVCQSLFTEQGESRRGVRMVIVVGPRSRSARGSDGGVGRSRTDTFIGWPGGWMSAASENESFLDGEVFEEVCIFEQAI